ncbi:hypothetical protein CLU79DRAFT_725528 [Phycomyces nitens]|nr:hypothetical protein CLU79DRAFT_725528 [Phycomyces nitens]
MNRPKPYSSPSLDPLLSNENGLDIVSPQPINWDQLRKEARQLENEIELKLASLAKAGANCSTQGSYPADNSKMSQELEIEALLTKLQSVISAMTEFLDRPSATPTTPSMVHLLDRHRDILYDTTKEFRKVKSQLKAARDKADLMNQVRDEIRSSNAGNTDNADYYLTERNRVESSHRMTDSIIEQAYATRQDISRQGRTIHQVNSRVGGIIGRLPGINNIISRINTRRKRDTLIMAGVISCCIIFITLYWLHT